MNSNATHIIRRQRYDIKVATQQQGRRMQQHLQEFNLQRLLPALHTHFNEWFSSSDEVITIDKVEIDVGHINVDATENEWLEKIIFQITQKLKTARHNNIFSPENETIPMVKTNAVTHAFDALLFFLQNGLLPQSIYQNVEAVFNALYEIEATEKVVLKDELTKQADTFMYQRLAMLTHKQTYFIIQLFVPGISEDEWISWLVALPEFFNKINVNVQGKLSIQQKAALKNQLLLFLFNKLFQLSKLEKLISWKQVKEIVEQHLVEIIPQAESTYDIKTITDNYFEKEVTITKEKLPLKKDEKLIAPEGIFVTNAGICLAAPYISMFFKVLEFTDGAVFLSTHSQQRAIHVLHFLASGKEDASEEKLVFTKILCGWPLQMPLTEEIELTETERTEAVELLQSMIEHWQALKSTSPDGLREGFLQRNGKLSDKEDNYLLQVEHQSIDILLEYIPWQFRFIRLPWMKRSIEVEWY